MIEPKPPAGATRPGGNAVVLDWSMLAGWQAPAPWLLAGGLTPERLAAQLKEGLEGAGVKNPDLVVEVIQVNSRRFSIQGEVLRPGVFPLVVPIHVFDALGMASGFKEFANKKKILILRADGSRLFFSYDDFVKGKKRDQNVLIQNGDTIIVR